MFWGISSGSLKMLSAEVLFHPAGRVSVSTSGSQLARGRTSCTRPPCLLLCMFFQQCFLGVLRVFLALLAHPLVRFGQLLCTFEPLAKEREERRGVPPPAHAGGLLGARQSHGVATGLVLPKRRPKAGQPPRWMRGLLQWRHRCSWHPPVSAHQSVEGPSGLGLSPVKSEVDALYDASKRTSDAATPAVSTSTATIATATSSTRLARLEPD